jgi:basic endochitinase B
MKIPFLTSCFGIMALLPGVLSQLPEPGIGFLITKEQYQAAFPHHHPIYSFESLVEASRNFPLFTNEGSLISRKRELIAFLANVAHETANSSDNTYSWGLYFTEEQACKEGQCPQYNNPGSSNYQPVPGKSYHGRGPLQLSYTYNYGLAGKELDLPLLEHPELVSTDGIIGFKTAIWFWMREQKPKPSCHDVMCGKWLPMSADSLLHRKPGFGMTINIINGGVECNTDNLSLQNERNERIGFYKKFSKMMSIPIEEDCDCKGMGIY